MGCGSSTPVEENKPIKRDVSSASIPHKESPKKQKKKAAKKKKPSSPLPVKQEFIAPWRREKLASARPPGTYSEPIRTFQLEINE
jgi:hypothetical protein